MKDVVIVDAIRTPMAMADNGIFRHVRADTLSARLMQTLLDRNVTLYPPEIAQVIWGCAGQQLEQGGNIARHAMLMTSIPHSVSGQTVNMMSGSSMQAIHQATMMMQCGYGDVCIVGGVEHSEHIPTSKVVDLSPQLGKYAAKASHSGSLCAELVTRMHGFKRSDQDEFALRSYQKARQARDSGAFGAEIVALEGHYANGALSTFDSDQTLDQEISFDGLGQMKGLFHPRAAVTAGNSAMPAVAASALLMMTTDKADELNLEPLAKVKSAAVTACDPALTALSAVAAVREALTRGGLSVGDIDLWEVNEDSAAQTLPVLRELGLLSVIEDQVNLNGGAIALGQADGCSGARLSTTLLRLMQSKDANLGVAAMSTPMGQGIATVFERV